MDRTFTVYLCGPIMGCTDAECKDWRDAAKEELSLVRIRCLDPMTRDYRGRELECYVEIVELDKVDILNSDVLLVNYPKPSTGTDMEILFAWEQHKRVIVVVPKDARVSPWLKYHTHAIYNSFNDAIGYIIHGLYGKS